MRFVGGGGGGSCISALVAAALLMLVVGSTTTTASAAATATRMMTIAVTRSVFVLGTGTPSSTATRRSACAAAFSTTAATSATAQRRNGIARTTRPMIATTRDGGCWSLYNGVGDNNNIKNSRSGRRFGGVRALSSSTSASSTTTSPASAEREEGTAAVQPQAADETKVLASLQSPFLKIMRDRGFLHQCTSYAELDDVLMGGRSKDDNDKVDADKSSAVVRAYLGFDATADSLHVGSLLQIMILRWFQKCGHQPVVLLGGGTSKVGDPTGKDESRVLLTDAVIRHNIAGISGVFAKFLKLAKNDDDAQSSSTDAIIVNNNDWLSQLSYLDFLRDYGTHFTINRMLSFESVKQRLAREAPFSFLEFNYMILQAYDFLELHRRYQVKLQLGGSDQWGNMIAGVELGRRVDGAQLFALTAPLVTTSDGRKMGKTASGAVWLNEDRLSPYEYWQFWRNTNDQDVIKFLKLFTELSLEDIEEMSTWTGSDINRAKVVLADRATELLHGPDVLPGIHETVQQMFSAAGRSGGGDGSVIMKTEGLARVQVTKAQLVENGGGVRVADLLAELKLAPSKKEARRLIAGGGCRKSIGGAGEEVKIVDEVAVLTLQDFGDNDGTEVVLRAGKKRAGVVELVD